MRNHKKVLSAVAGLAAAVLLMTGCGGSSDGAGTTGGSGGGGKGAVLTIGMPNGTQTDNHNPFGSTSSAKSLGYANVLYEPIAQVNDINPAEEPIPWLASEWEWNTDFTQITITPREGVLWSDGETLTADDIAFSYQMRKDNPSINADALPYGDISVADGKVVVTFTNGQFTNQAKLLKLLIVPKHIWEKVAEPGEDVNKNPIGTGPYTLESWTPQAATLKARTDYWGGELAVPELRYSSYTDNAALTNALISGEVQWGWTFIPSIEDIFISADSEHNKFWAAAGLGADVLYLNTTVAPFNDVAVRKAVSMVLDRDQTSELATTGQVPAINSVVGLPEPAGTPFITADFVGKEFTPDVEGAKKVLTDAGYTYSGDTLIDPSGAPVFFTLSNPAGWSDYLTGLELISAAVKEIGIDTSVDAMNQDAWFTAIAEGDFQASMHWTDTGATPWDIYANIMDGAQLKPVGESAAWNFGRFDNVAATTALATYASSPDPAVRDEALATIQQVFVDEVPAISVLTRPYSAQYTTKNYVGWPDAENPYAPPTPTLVQASLILTKLKPAQD